MHYGLKNLHGSGDPFGYFTDDNWWLSTVPPDSISRSGSQQSVLYGPDGGSGSASKAGHSGTSGATVVTSPTTSSTSGLVIDINWDASVASAPTAFTTAVTSAVHYLESLFDDPVTITISVGYGEVDGSALGSNELGESWAYLNSYGYSTIKSALAADATSATDASVVASLPATAPTNGTYWLTTANAKALGLASGTGTDGFVGFSSSLPFTYNDSNGVAAGTYDFNGTALHELTEVMGRLMFTGGTIGTTANSYGLLDLFHYSSAGVLDTSASTSGYFSTDGGTTNQGQFNTVSGGDPGDWSSSMGNDSFDAFSNSGVINSFSADDTNVLDAIGWNLAGSSKPSTPTGVSVTAITSSPSGAALSANTSIAMVSQVGGASTDTYSYSLGGAAASMFKLSASGNVATLAAGQAGLAGLANGQLYALTLTATDVTSGMSAAPNALDIIVGTAGSDTINVAALSGALGTSTPTFIYGLAGNDRLNGTGYAGKLWIDGGAGADTLTGGSGVNDYLYTAASDSTAMAMDVITNFHGGSDLIDLTGLGITLRVAGTIGKNKPLAAESIGWQSSSGNTYIYVNTSAGSESISGTNMKIDLAGSVSLSSSNFVHL
jgi:hypothetical protein